MSAKTPTVEEAGQVAAVVEEAVRTFEQGALGICDTCSHTREEHPADGPCKATWTIGGDEAARVSCDCLEFWPIRRQLEDGLLVVGHELNIGGGVTVRLNRRQTSELWESLRAGRHVSLTFSLRVQGKGFKVIREKGVIVGLAEVRKLKADDLVLGLDAETGELQ